MFSKLLLSRIAKLITLAFIMFMSFTAAGIHAQDATAEVNKGAEATKINITLLEYSFHVEGQAVNEPLQLTVGTAYEMTIRNSGLLDHELLIGTDVQTVTGGFLHDYGAFLLDGVEAEISGVMNDKDFTIVAVGLHEIQLGTDQEVTLAFTLPDDKVGTWEAGCFNYLLTTSTDDNPGSSHYDAGMKLEVDVVQAE